MESTILSSQKHVSLSSQPSVTYDPAAIPEATKDHDDIISEQFEDAEGDQEASTGVESNIAKSVALNADEANKFAGVGNDLPFYDASDDNDDNKKDNESSSTSEVIIAKEEASVKISNNKRKTDTDTETKTLLSSGSESSANNDNGGTYDQLSDAGNGNSHSDSSSASIAIISPSTIDNDTDSKNSKNSNNSSPDNSSPEVITSLPSYNIKLSGDDGTADTEVLVVNTVKEQLNTKFILNDSTQVPSRELDLQVTGAVRPLDTPKSMVLNTPIAADFVQTITTNDKLQLYTVEATTSAAAEGLEQGNTTTDVVDTVEEKIAVEKNTTPEIFRKTDEAIASSSTTIKISQNDSDEVVNRSVNKPTSKSETNSGHGSSNKKLPRITSSVYSSTSQSDSSLVISPKKPNYQIIPDSPKSLVEKIKANPKNTAAAIAATAFGLILIGSLIYAVTHPTKTKDFFASVGKTGVALAEGMGQLVRNFFADPQFNKKLVITIGVSLLVIGLIAAVGYGLHAEGKKADTKASNLPGVPAEFPRTMLVGVNSCFNKTKEAVGIEA